MTLLASLVGSDISGLYLFFFSEGVSFGLYDIAKSLTIPGWGVIITLLIQSVFLIAVGIERWLTFNKAKQQSRQYAPKVAQALKNSNIDEAINISDKHKDSHLAMVVSSGLKEFAAHQGSSDISSDEMEASKRALERAIAVKTAELKRGLAGLATIGSTAPFVGLFGTVVGIIGAFQALRANETAGIGAVGGAIAEALVATAFGILVAVPAVWLFNYYTNKVASFGVEMENSASELVDYFIRQRSKQLKG
ncbi:MAG: MotA/TolQ/ExbB proton channel family protein [Acidobacteria bacterium]|nr:MotA/TolQ/ExbB proton channel family protein [Acidobacteriota bacterium]MCW5950433.1 MotA/TolQ/ExbB proton channel family protein [Pyrinomonadaceae bacterium]